MEAGLPLAGNGNEALHSVNRASGSGFSGVTAVLGASSSTGTTSKSHGL